jgi:hypothetical protein
VKNKRYECGGQLKVKSVVFGFVEVTYEPLS